jgi:hypothetical protein
MCCNRERSLCDIDLRRTTGQPEKAIAYDRNPSEATSELKIFHPIRPTIWLSAQNAMPSHPKLTCGTARFDAARQNRIIATITSASAMVFPSFQCALKSTQQDQNYDDD